MFPRPAIASIAPAAMSRPIDYSKWDHIGDSSDEEQEEGQEQQQEQRRGPPQVTKYDAPMSVTIGDGGSNSSGSTDGGAAAAKAKPPATTAAGARAVGAAAAPRPAPSEVEDVAENGDELEVIYL